MKSLSYESTDCAIDMLSLPNRNLQLNEKIIVTTYFIIVVLEKSHHD